MVRTTSSPLWCSDAEDSGCEEKDRHKKISAERVCVCMCVSVEANLKMEPG